MSSKRDFQSGDKASDSFFASFVRGIHDYFNPLLQAIEELQRKAKKNDKKR